MPEAFPRVEVASRSDVDRVFAQVQKHASRILRHELRREAKYNKTDEADALRECEAIIEAWIKSAKRRIEPNLNITGSSQKESGGDAEPFDQELSQRVQQLAAQADKMTADAIKARKTVPRERAALLSQRHDALQRRDEAREARRRRDEDDFARVCSSDDQDTPLPSLPRAEEVAATFKRAAEEIDERSVTILEQTSAAHEQANFVKRLRIMSASYT